MARLVCIEGPLDGQTFDLGDGVTIGRGTHNGIPMPKDRKASRDHCKVWKSGATSYAVADLGSTNGTIVNDGTTSRSNLSDGDVLQVGEAVFRFELDDAERPKPKTQPKAASKEDSRQDLAAMLRGETKPERSAATDMAGSIEFKQRILQYNKKGDKGTIDVSQTAGTTRYLIYIAAIGLFVALFLVMRGMFSADETTRGGQRPADAGSPDPGSGD